MQWLFLFFFYSFFGWCFESTYVSVHEKHFVNRGFMRAPFLPLYGSGGIMMLVVSKPFYENLVLVFIAGCIGATALEYVTAVVMEALFKVRYWDYSHKKIHFQGRISLESSIVWGICTVVFTHFLQIPIEKLILSIPYNIMTYVVVVTTIFVSCDFMMAFRTALDLRDVLMYMEKAKNEMQRMQKRLDVIIAFKGEDMREGFESKMEELGNTPIGAAASVIGSAASAIGSGVGSAASAIGSGVGSAASAIGSGVGSAASAIGSGVSSRLDVLGNAVGSSFDKIREKISINPSEYASGVKEEVMELYTKYRIIMDKVTTRPIKNFVNWYRRNTILGNPTITSDDYQNSIEELKDKVNHDQLR
jgi:uncharacterized membrane protein